MVKRKDTRINVQNIRYGACSEIGFMKIYFTKAKMVVDKITGEIFNLEEELGVWTWDKKIYVYSKIPRKEKLKTLIHEVIECFLVVNLGMKQERAHRIACLVEKIII